MKLTQRDKEEHREGVRWKGSMRERELEREKKVHIYKAISLLPCLGVTAKCYII